MIKVTETRLPFGDRAELRIFDPRSDEPPRLVPLDGKPGTIVGVGPDHVLTLYEFPQLIELPTGTGIRNWPHIRSGAQRSSILLGTSPLRRWHSIVPVSASPWRTRMASRYSPFPRCDKARTFCGLEVLWSALVTFELRWGAP